MSNFRESKYYVHSKDIYHTLKRDIKSRIKSQKVKKPTVINFQANDICNSKCTMCFIWEQKKDKEISPEEFGKILSDPLYSEVQHIGITGGEPTLRKDLPELYEVACKTLPNLKGMSSITNAIQKKQVIERIERSGEICHQHGKSFSLMVSLDGYGDMHDLVRGRKGNFKTAIEVIKYFQKTPFPVSIGCTVTKDNVWDVDELLDFLIEEGIYGRFRVAEFIQRLYNEGATEIIRNFNEDESYQLMLFFKKLELYFENNPTYKRTYLSILNMLRGEPRGIGCPYQTEGISLDCRGNIAYCAPKSKVIGNTLETSGEQLYQENLSERNRLLEEECGNCIHDYHAPATVEDQAKFVKNFYLKHALSLKNFPVQKHILKPSNAKLYQGEQADKVIFITGWYGTETVGDKAILAGIIQHFQKEYKTPKFVISSLYPFVTERTLNELNTQAEIVYTYEVAFLNVAASADIIVMGGGPLMHIDALSLPLWAFYIAKKYKKQTVVFGCGIGPLGTPYYEKIVKQILGLSDEILLRDQASVEKAKQYLPDSNSIRCIGDPAHHYLLSLKNKLQSATIKPILACFLREWGEDYKGDLSDEEFVQLRTKFELKLAKEIKKTCAKYNLKPAFYSMHTFAVGGDDRTFYRRFTKTYFADTEFTLDKGTSSVKVIVKAMKEATFCLAMRFHSVLFAHTLETNYFAIDYTNGGKIKGFLTDNQATNRMIGLREFAEHSAFDLSSQFSLPNE